MKICNNCKQEFPRTKEFWHFKNIKKGTLINGTFSKKDYSFPRHLCKKCQNKKNREASVKRSAKKRGMSIEEYNIFLYGKAKVQKRTGMKAGSEAAKTLSKIKSKYEYPEGMSKKEKVKMRIIMDKGYAPETYQEEWKKKWLKKQKAKRKYDYPKDLEKLTQTIRNKKYLEVLPNAVVANRLGLSVFEVPKELIELKRKQLKLFRYGKKT